MQEALAHIHVIREVSLKVLREVRLGVPPIRQEGWRKSGECLHEIIKIEILKGIIHGEVVQ